MDSLDDFIMTRPPTAKRPLLGLTVLIVEDSRFASEALRLLCLRSGARIRRADTMAHARRHLRTYRPSVVIVDVGLPDGSGTALIAELAQASPRVDVLLGMSGDDDAHSRAIKAGADGFLAKPISSLSGFQAAILEHLPRDRRPTGPRVLEDDQIAPDDIAFRDDLAAAAAVLEDAPDLAHLRYVSQFLGGVARSAGDAGLTDALARLDADIGRGTSPASAAASLAAVVQDRIAAAPRF